MASDDKAKTETRRFAPVVSGPPRDKPGDSYDLAVRARGHMTVHDAIEYKRKHGPFKKFAE